MERTPGNMAATRRLVFLAFAVALTVQSAWSHSRDQTERTVFWVYENSSPLKGVSAAFVFVVTAAGTEQIGRTDAEGEVAISVAILNKGHALMFCRDQEGVSCAAVRLDTGVLRGFAEFNVQMPTFRIVDRVKATPLTHLSRSWSMSRIQTWLNTSTCLSGHGRSNTA